MPAERGRHRDEQVLHILKGATFGPKARVTLPSGKVLSGDEAQAWTSYYADDTKGETMPAKREWEWDEQYYQYCQQYLHDFGHPRYAFQGPTLMPFCMCGSPQKYHDESGCILEDCLCLEYRESRFSAQVVELVALHGPSDHLVQWYYDARNKAREEYRC